MVQTFHLYSDDTPDPERGGLASVLGNVIQSNSFDGKSCLVLNVAQTNEALPPAGKGAFVNGWNFLSQRGVSVPLWMRIPFVLVDLISTLIFRRKVPTPSPSLALCVIVGIDWTAMLRGLLVARALGFRKKTVYVVDNFFEHMPHGQGLFAPFTRGVAKWFLNRFDAHFAITKGLASALERGTTNPWLTTPLPYDFSVPFSVQGTVTAKEVCRRGLNASSKAMRNQLLFVGALSPFVVPMIDRLAKLISEDIDTADKLTLHVISRNISIDFLRRHETSIIRGHLTVNAGLDDKSIREGFWENGVFVCPYSDRIDHKSFVTQSFPSKLLKMVQSGIPCLIVGPDYSAVAESHGEYIQNVHLNDSLSPLRHAIAYAEDQMSHNTDSLAAIHDINTFLQVACSA